MEAYRHAHHAHMRTSHLTQLYSDTKKSALTSVNWQSSVGEQFPDLRRKFKIQKDRLITWGLAWSDDEKGADGNIDDAVARAGLTETVDSVLRNIKEVTEEAERIQQASFGIGLGGDKAVVKPVTFDQARYEDLLNDLTTSIDTLYDLSRSRRALARGEHPSFRSTSTQQSNTGKPSVVRGSLPRSPSFAPSEVTLVNPSFQRPTLSPYAGLPPSIEPAALRLPNETPPAYESQGVPWVTRSTARLIRCRASEGVQSRLGSSAPEVPVLVEYANFDTVYRDTHVPPPLQRLEALAAYLQPMRAESQTNLSLLGYFEDPDQPRLGLVYDVPYLLQNKLQGNSHRAPQNLISCSLLNLIQKASKSQASPTELDAPPLEDRFTMALRLTEQLHSMHASQLAHGNISSNSVVLTMTAAERPQQHIRAPLWASFDLFSKCTVEGVSRAVVPNLYRHPADFPQNPNRILADDIKYDLYSLAIVLLEVGFWKPVSDFFKSKYTPADFQLRLERVYIPKLAHRCGSAYMQAVQACFRLADEVNITKLSTDDVFAPVIGKLRKCCMLDDDGLPEASSTTTSLAENAGARPGSKAMSSVYGSFPEANTLARQQSDPNQNFASPTSAPQRLASLPNLAAASVGPYPDRQHTGQIPASRRVSTHSHMSRQSMVSQHRDRQSSGTVTQPSFKEYKRKIILLQQVWRQRCARLQNAATAPLAERQMAVSNNDKVKTPPRRSFPTMRVPQTVIDHWEGGAMCHLAKVCQRALKGSLESSSIELTMYGETPDTARPTFLITCRSTKQVKQALRKHFKHDPSICDVRVKPTTQEITRCRRSKRHGDSAARRTMAPETMVDHAANPDYQERPLCGASIGAYRDEEHLPPVSFGGIVLVDDIPYGMSVHHMLEPPDDDLEEQDPEAGATGGAEDDGSDSSSIGSDDSDDDSTVRPTSVSDTDSFIEEHEGDLPGIAPEDYEEEIEITQPALDDAIGCNLHADADEDDDDSIDDDHLSSYTLGEVFASSGLKRSGVGSTRDGYQGIASLPQEIDWALIKLKPPRVHPFNVIQGGSKYCAMGRSCGNSYPISIRDSSALAFSSVHCIGRTSGLASGIISSTMELVKIHGRSTFSASWTVSGEFGVGGDSGAWVVGNDDGKVCGHVVASRRGRTYICPMELLLKDIKETLKASSVALPGAADDGLPTGVAQAVASVGKLRLDEREHGGGVALPVSPARRSIARKAIPHIAAPIETAG
ncbi:hypothetical protein BAUCODRAFT_26369 [Baudoinia panamericana UAMH 10762]|uniref:Uncharacterized protein n=1 Tax=Baudoinia panamericana (strain UAMH 10762) TaxID=717646 RepID=M2LIZ7_BAUPA|nr:uncharacterized protein BAUCODRAFT_26369 [Baudoinia panamericana UAMH 10762]EMC94187.1 hypothetical protein BAUCODRAFT_26369 [Baudoinia panamericana UAMH 10762]